MNERQPKKYEPIGEIVSIYLRGKTWWANFQHCGKQKKKSLRTSSKKEARRQALLLEAALLKGQFTETIKPATIEDAIQRYLSDVKTRKRQPNTIDKYTTLFDRVLKLSDRLKRKSLLQLDLTFLDHFRKERVEVDEIDPDTTLVDEIVTIRQLLNFALARKLIADDPLNGMRIPKRRRRPQPWWKPHEVEQILALAKEPHVWEFTILADSGFRIAELQHLTWDDVDFENNLLHVRPKEVSPSEYWRPKDGDQRSVPMSDRVRSLLERLPRHARWVVTAPKSPKYPKGDARISSRRALVVLKRILKRLGLQGHLHTFRHSLISRALISGVPEAVVREWAGHVDSEILARYTHISSEVSQQSMKKLSIVESTPLNSEVKGH